MARVLVTGGTGLLGGHLVPILIERGHEVRVVARHLATVADGAELLLGDVRTGEGLGPAVENVDAVVHAATSPRRGARKTDLFLSYPLFIRTPNLAFQVVDTADFAGRLADLVDTGPAGRAPDFGGPEVLNINDLAASRREITGRRARLLRVPRIGPVRDFDNGVHLCPHQRSGQRTWREWLLTGAGPSALSR
jgi:uncharacterized protein YbjT (DUF2867 family)